MKDLIKKINSIPGFNPEKMRQQQSAEEAVKKAVRFEMKKVRPLPKRNTNFVNVKVS